MIAKNSNIIKRVTRKLPETNSSSSHSLIIDMESVELLDPSIDLFDYDKEGNILLKDDIEFGRSNGKYNDLYTKLVYASAAICRRVDGIEDICKRLAELEKVVVDFTGVKGIRFLWIEENFNRIERDKRIGEEIKYRSTFNELYECSPEIDHDSIDRTDEVLESEETLKNFLFNRNSYIITGGDDSEDNDYLDVHCRRRDVPKTMYLRVHLEEPIGDLDIELDESSDDPTYVLTPDTFLETNSNSRLLKMLQYTDDGTNKVLEYRGVHSAVWKSSTYRENLLCWSSKKFNDRFCGLVEGLGVPKKYYVDQTNFDKTIALRNKVMKELPGEYKLVKFDLISEEFGLC